MKESNLVKAAENKTQFDLKRKIISNVCGHTFLFMSRNEVDWVYNNTCYTKLLYKIE